MRCLGLLFLAILLFPIIATAKNDCQLRLKKTGFTGNISALYTDASKYCDQNLKDRLLAVTMKNHIGLTYRDAKPWIYKKLDANSKGIICSFYSPFDCKKKSDSSKSFSFNVEHIWPQSQGARTLPAQGDLHHLFITTQISNTKRASYKFCNVKSLIWQSGGSKFGLDKNNEKCFEPTLSSKGNVARAMFYFSIRYNMPIEDDIEQTLKKWNKIDPVTMQDRKRNRQIIKIQGNTNPFIEYPKLVNLISDF